MTGPTPGGGALNSTRWGNIGEVFSSNKQYIPTNKSGERGKDCGGDHRRARSAGGATALRATSSITRGWIMMSLVLPLSERPAGDPELSSFTGTRGVPLRSGL